MYSDEAVTVVLMIMMIIIITNIYWVLTIYYSLFEGLYDNTFIIHNGIK